MIHGYQIIGGPSYEDISFSIAGALKGALTQHEVSFVLKLTNGVGQQVKKATVNSVEVVKPGVAKITGEVFYRDLSTNETRWVPFEVQEYNVEGLPGEILGEFEVDVDLDSTNETQD